VEKYCGAGQATDGNMAHAGYVRLRTYIQNMKCFLLFHYNSGFAKARERCAYMYSTLLVFVILYFPQNAVAIVKYDLKNAGN